MMSSYNVLLIICFLFLLIFYIPIKIKEDPVLKKFNLYLKKYNKSYKNTTIYSIRFEAFKKSLSKIEYLNSLRKNNESAFYGLTQYSDMPEKEFTENFLQLDMYERINSRKDSSPRENSVSKRSIEELPQKVDWRERNVINKVINQKSCGGCWAFSVVANIESMFALKHGKLVSLSAQQLIDCSINNNGCNGGDMCSLLNWMLKNDVKVQSEEKYPLHLRTENCKINSTIDEGVQVEDYVCGSLAGSEYEMLYSLAFHGPIAVAINAVSWQNYLGGVIQYHCNSSEYFLNHAVQIVGYNLNAEIPHYIIKNSWGENFGDKGYLYIGIGKNLCGLANEVIAVDVL